MRKVSVFSAVLACMLASAASFAATVAPDPSKLTPFILPWDDAGPGVTNVSGLIDKPAGVRGFIKANNGHLYSGSKRIRFFGTNVTFTACFPTHTEAEKIAARLAKFGVNCVRFHHMDNSWGSGILASDGRTLDAARLERLDYFIFQLRKNGIYSDLNLHVSRTYPGMPTWTGMADFFKGVDNFYPGMIDLQKEYARTLLTHLNPYTKTRYVDEPAVAFVEINNENGLITSWWWGWLDAMPDPYSSELKRQWNAWLTAKYRDSAALKRAWSASARPLGTEMLTNGGFSKGMQGWPLEVIGSAKGSAEVLSDGPNGKPALHVRVTRVGAEPWHVQLPYPGLKLHDGELYTLTFWAKADTDRGISLNAMQAHDPWRQLWAAQARLGTGWKQYRFSVLPSVSDDNARITFTDLGMQTGEVCFADISLRPGGGSAGPGGDALGGIEIIGKSDYAGMPVAAQRDWMNFLWETEERYWLGMYRFLKSDLKTRSLVFGTQACYSPAPMQAKLDLVDNHSYWHHPQFPGKAWDSNNWIVPNVSMAGLSDGGTLPALAFYRVVGKPYLVTEYNHPAPNTHNSEAFLLLAAYGALQDWDGIFSFDYASSGADWNGGKIGNFFDIDQHPTQMATLPAAAAIFLRGDVHSPTKTNAIELTPSMMRELIRKSDNWLGALKSGLDPLTALRQPVGLLLTSRAKPAAPAKGIALPVASGNGELNWSSGVVTVNTARTKAVIGSTAGGPFRLGGVMIDPRPNLQNWAAITVTSMQGKDLSSPGHILITATGYSQNTGSKWLGPIITSADSPWGTAPSLIEGIPATITLPFPAARVQVWSLDERGQRRDLLPVRDVQGKATFDIGPKYGTVWYEVGVE